jgi:cytochrome c oxidase assembly protein subunit 15
MHLNNVGSLWLRRYAVFVACCTFVLVIAGALVASNDAALSIPDWPLSWGRLIPTLEGGIRYEFAHRVAAMLVGLLTVGLAFAVRTRLAWAAVAVVVAQAALGGVAVRFVTPAWATIAHAALGQLFFALLIAICVKLYAGAQPGHPIFAPPAVCALMLFGQTVLGAGVRYGVVVPVVHIVGAVANIIPVMWVGLAVLNRYMDDPALRRLAMLLLSLTFSQVFLGIAAMMARIVYADAPQPMPMMVLFTVAHVAVGSLALGAAVALAMLLRLEVVPANGGMVTA